MNKIVFLTAVIALSLPVSGASAQPSQAQGGGATAPTSNPPAANDATRPGGMGTSTDTPSGANPSSPSYPGKGAPAKNGNTGVTGR